MKGIFDLSILGENVEQEQEVDILDEVINEDVSISVPGGDKETPSKNGIDISADEYNKALTSLKKSFKEGYEILDMLEKTNVVTDEKKDKDKEDKDKEEKEDKD